MIIAIIVIESASSMHRPGREDFGRKFVHYQDEALRRTFGSFSSFSFTTQGYDASTATVSRSEEPCHDGSICGQVVLIL